MESAPASKKRRALAIGLPIGLAVVVVAAILMIRASRYESTDDAFVDAHVVPISARVAGQVTSVRVEDNQAVAQGAVLAEIDPRDFEAKVAEERAKVRAAEAEARRAAADAKRYRQIFARDEISRQQLDQAETTAAASEAALARERAVLQKAELDLSYATITAPEAGRVTRRSVVPGAYLQVGQTLMTIVPEQVWITANFKETQLRHMRPGQKVDITVDAFKGIEFQGHVDSIQSGTGERFSLMPPENATGNFVKVVQRIPVKIVIDSAMDPNHRLAPGMSAVPKVRVKE